MRAVCAEKVELETVEVASCEATRVFDLRGQYGNRMLENTTKSCFKMEIVIEESLPKLRRHELKLMEKEINITTIRKRTKSYHQKIHAR